MHLTVWDSMPEKQFARAALHEFGHALGSVHDHHLSLVNQILQVLETMPYLFYAALT